MAFTWCRVRAEHFEKRFRAPLSEQKGSCSPEFAGVGHQRSRLPKGLLIREETSRWKARHFNDLPPFCHIDSTKVFTVCMSTFNIPFDVGPNAGLALRVRGDRSLTPGTFNFDWDVSDM